MAQIDLSTDEIDRFLMQLVHRFWRNCQQLWLALREEYPLGDAGFSAGRAVTISLLVDMASTFRSYKYYAQEQLLVEAQNDLLQVDTTSLIDRPNKYTIMGTLEDLGVALGMGDKSASQSKMAARTKKSEQQEMAKMKSNLSMAKAAVAVGKPLSMVLPAPQASSLSLAGSPMSFHFGGGLGAWDDSQSVVSGAASAIWAAPSAPPSPLPAVAQPFAPGKSPAELKEQWEKKTSSALFSWGKRHNVKDCVSCDYLRIREGADTHKMRECPNRKKALDAFHRDRKPSK
jgi:hypothetical protein